MSLTPLTAPLQASTLVEEHLHWSSFCAKPKAYGRGGETKLVVTCDLRAGQTGSVHRQPDGACSVEWLQRHTSSLRMRAVRDMRMIGSGRWGRAVRVGDDVITQLYGFGAHSYQHCVINSFQQLSTAFNSCQQHSTAFSISQQLSIASIDINIFLLSGAM